LIYYALDPRPNSCRGISKESLKNIFRPPSWTNLSSRNDSMNRYGKDKGYAKPTEGHSFLETPKIFNDSLDFGSFIGKRGSDFSNKSKNNRYEKEDFHNR